MKEYLLVEATHYRWHCPACHCSGSVKGCTYQGQPVGKDPEKEARHAHKNCQGELVWHLTGKRQEGYPVKVKPGGEVERA